MPALLLPGTTLGWPRNENRLSIHTLNVFSISILAYTFGYHITNPPLDFFIPCEVIEVRDIIDDQWNEITGLLVIMEEIWKKKNINVRVIAKWGNESHRYLWFKIISSVMEVWCMKSRDKFFYWELSNFWADLREWLEMVSILVLYWWFFIYLFIYFLRSNSIDKKAGFGTEKKLLFVIKALIIDQGLNIDTLNYF